MNGFDRDEYRHTAELLRSDNEKIARATASNNHNIILSALDICGADPTDGDLPSADEALAYASGYVAGLEAARNQEAAQLIKERDVLQAQCAFERALRSVFERRNTDLIGRIAELEARLVEQRA